MSKPRSATVHASLAGSPFSGLAETSSRYTWTGRQYHGVIGRRRFSAYVTQVRDAHGAVSGGVYSGEHLEIVLDSNMKVRLRVGPYNQRISKVGDHQKDDLTALTEASPEALITYAHDVGWGLQILNDEKDTGLLLELLTSRDQFEIRNLSLWPGAVMLSLHRLNPADLTAENVKNWLTRLTDWLERLESLHLSKLKLP